MGKNLRKEAKGRECQVRIAKKCSGRETTILAHINKKSLVGAGIGMKPPDIFGSHCCAACHDILDGRNTATLHPWWELEIAMYEGMIRTQNILLAEGKL